MSDTHVRFGWWSLLVFAALGLVLESLHGLKLDFYLAVGNETRRLLWTLAHAHGVLLSLVNVVFGLTLPRLGDWSPQTARLASRSLMAATVILPAGFFLGGVVTYAGDPGLAVTITPLGALLLLVGVFLTARATKRGEPPR